MAGLGPNEVRVIVRGGAMNGRDVTYRRPFVNLTVAEAISRLRDSSRRLGELPMVIIRGPYLLNGKEVDNQSTRVLQPGDVLSADDP